MARLSPKHLVVLFLALFLTAGFCLSAAQASIMSARMAGTTVSQGHGLADMAMKRGCATCAKDSAGKVAMPCSSACLAAAPALVPQAIAIATVPPVQQPSTWPAPFLHGRTSLPEPYPPKAVA